MNPPHDRPRRKRSTRRGVRVSEFVARLLISVSGIATIIAVAVICVFLVQVVLPIFQGATVGSARTIPSQALERAPLALQVDEYGALVWSLHADGTLSVARTDSGELLQRQLLFPEAELTAMSFNPADDSVAFGFGDGTVRLGRIGFLTRFLEPDEGGNELAGLRVGQMARFGEGMVQRTAEGQLRLQALDFRAGEALDSGWTSAIRLIDHSLLPGGSILGALSEEGRLAVFAANTRVNLLTGEETTSLEEGEIPWKPAPGERLPWRLMLSGGGDNLMLAWEDGRLLRFDIRERQAAELVEEVDLVAEPAARLTALEPMIGKTTLVAGDSLGRIGGWFRIKPEGAGTRDGALLVRAHAIATGGDAVTALAPSRRSRLLGAGFSDGSVELYYLTSGEELVRMPSPDGQAPVLALTISPKEEALLAATPSGLWQRAFDPSHPEASLAGLFRPLWYEGYPGPEHVWQSSSGTDEFEPKLGMVPLIFGTLKATLYSMLFGVPIALLAAIFSSEFLAPRLRVPIKSTIEVMASLPSVVLGFLAALVIAPFVQELLPATLALFATIPLALLLGSYLWQLLPQQLTLRWSGWQRLSTISLMLPLGALGALVLGPMVEDLVFAGDIEQWLDGHRGSSVGGWFFLLLPGVGLLCVLLAGRFVAPWLRGASVAWNRLTCARFDLARFLIGALAVGLLALGGAVALDALGFDPRGNVFDTYVQRNALVVGFVMGFAIIPIIYTLSEDALSSVPEHLREASLGSGATPWQTATRIIVPTAMSGLFSAVMIGLGRAVGETMIVLMATGNTPVTDWNVFSGFRTLSANIAVELPEAVRNSTHYRTLFLAALVLFALTFVVNTLAELVRQRFRRRAYQL